MEESVIDNCNL